MRPQLLSYGSDTETLRMRLEAAVLRRLPARLRRPLRQLMYLPADLLDAVFDRREELVPPRRLISVGAGDFKATGEQYLVYLQEYCRLHKSSRLLDVGCGIGRMAVPMTRYLGGQGSYDGLDVAAADIRWCQRHMTPKHPNFRFHHADIYHREYNPGGKLAATEYEFPFPDGSFDLVLASSLFTHLMAAEIEHYLSEIARVLSARGISFITFFLLNEESRRLIDAGACGLRFEHSSGDAYIHDRKNPESAVAYDEAFVRKLYARQRLKISEPVLHGCWCCRERYTSYQDIVIAAGPPTS